MKRTTLPSTRYAWVAVALLAAPLAACSSRGGHISSTETALSRYESCSALETDLKDMMAEEIEYEYEMSQRWWGGGGPVAEDQAGGDTNAPPTPNKDYSTTNNQEQGVDEGDLVKTDGQHIYVLNGTRLHIFGVPTFGQLLPESVTNIEGFPSEMVVSAEAKKVAVFSQIYPSQLPEEHPLYKKLRGDYTWERWGFGWWPWSSVSAVTVLDVADPAHPKVLRQLYLSGDYQTARLVDGTVRTATYTWFNRPSLWSFWADGRSLYEMRILALRAVESIELDDLIPVIYERLPTGQFTAYRMRDNGCGEFYRPSDSHAHGITTLLSLDLLASGFAVDADQIVTNYPVIYASTDRTVIAEFAHDWWWYYWNEDDSEKTNLHVFDTNKPGHAVYRGSGRVDGTIRNQFSLSEHEGHLRVASTVNRWFRWWDDTATNQQPQPPDNHVFVLSLAARDHKLPVVGHVGEIAPGETIQSTRFVGDKGYVVTFRRVDPLFTMDLSDPTAPRVVGELKIPGFATYIHPIADGRLLTIGFGGDDNGTNWRSQVSLLDASDFANPTLQDVQELAAGDEWAWSEALWNHKAFTYWAPKKVLAVPVSAYRQIFADGDYSYDYSSVLELVTVDLAAGLSYKGRIDHSEFFNVDPNVWWSNRDVRRSIFMGDYVYAFSDRGVTVHRTDDLAPITKQPLPGYKEGDQYYWWW